MEIYLKQSGSASNGNSTNIHIYNVQEIVPQFSANAIANKLGDIYIPSRRCNIQRIPLSKILPFLKIKFAKNLRRDFQEAFILFFRSNTLFN